MGVVILLGWASKKRGVTLQTQEAPQMLKEEASLTF